MSTLEKNLYKRVQVADGQVAKRPASSAAYRSISTVNLANDSFRLYDLAVIKQDIINHFYIRQGEKLENPEFGCIVWDVLFDPLTDVLKQAIIKNIEDIIDYDPRVTADQVIVTEYESGLQIECVLIYLDYSIAETMQLQFDQVNGLTA
jgi:phage baseplate assembly protein W